LKTKIQLYAMAAFFLFFLYDSPAGLLFYWTLNNLFSLLKNIFYKLKNPKKVLSIVASIAGIIAIIYGAIVNTTLTNKAVLMGFGVLLQAPILLGLYFKKNANKKKNDETYNPDKKVFIYAALLLTAIIGVLIPSSVITSSAQEFVNLYDYHHPLWYVVSACALAFGTFVIWFGVFYWLASKHGKVIFEKVMWVSCGVSIVDYMFFGTNLGILTKSLTYENDFDFTKWQKLVNIALLIILAIVMITALKKSKKFAIGAMTTGILAISCMSCWNMYQINNKIIPLKSQIGTVTTPTPQFSMSKDGKNVVVLMLDRAIGPFVPYMFNERPELAKQFDGFTYYSNTMSFGMCTNFGSPALYGGYEYTPTEIDKRDTESLVSKQNESLKVMPVLFDQNNYAVSVFDIPYANYSWVPDLSIYDDYPNIKKDNLQGKYNDSVTTNSGFKANCRNFFCYGLMKSSPIAIQHLLYNFGSYFNTNTDDSSSYIATEFEKSYNVLKNLPALTNVEDSSDNNFLMMDNDVTHMDLLLQEPEYEYTKNIDNSKYDAEYANRFTVNNQTINMSNPRAIPHYDVNMAAMIQLGNWFDYLRENDLYDNTRIILVADHGFPLGFYDNMLLTNDDGTSIDLDGYAPLLMVKDFNATGFSTSDEFMTNGDVPTIATSGVIDNPTNPFTGKAINNDEKTAHDQYAFASTEYDVDINNGNTFIPDDWYSVHDNIWDPNNWKRVATQSILPTN